MDQIFWNTQNIPMRSFIPLTLPDRNHYDNFLQLFFRKWIRHDERLDRHVTDSLISFTIYREKDMLGHFELGYFLLEGKLSLSIHRAIHERIFEQFGRDSKNWPDDFHRSAKRMDVFYLRIERELRLFEERIHSQHDEESTKMPLRTLLLEIINIGFDENELKTLCFHLNVVYDNLPADGKINKARELILLLERQNRLTQLLQFGKEIRPNALWPSDVI